MKRTETIIIGGGQAGLAMSRCLSDRGIDHVVLERGRVAERWRSERWDSARLLTPNWQSRLPGWKYQGHDPDGFMTMPEVVNYFEDYARSFSAPVQDRTAVCRVERDDAGYRVTTDRGVWTAPSVVIATGHCGVPLVPGMASRLSDEIHQLVPTQYRNPKQVPEGGVLVVGASASGLQLADELQRAGRRVTLAVGNHTRLPRSYRGRDIMWWLDAMGIFDDGVDDVSDLERARSLPSFQISGREGRQALDLGLLQDEGVQLVGRAVAATGHTMGFSDDLAVSTAEADAKLERILAKIDAYSTQAGLDDSVGRRESYARVQPAPAPTSIDLSAEGIGTVLWATGFRRSYPWLKVPVTDERGEIRHDRGVTPERGLYVLGLRFLRHRNSSFIDGVGRDAQALSEYVAAQTRRSEGAAA
jgi:putative flavoprotein involved in K+ transport